MRYRKHAGASNIVLCKSVVSEGKELISNWPIRVQETHGFSFLIGQFDINSFPSLTMDLQSTILGRGNKKLRTEGIVQTSTTTGVSGSFYSGHTSLGTCPWAHLIMSALYMGSCKTWTGLDWTGFWTGFWTQLYYVIGQCKHGVTVRV